MNNLKIEHTREEQIINLKCITDTVKSQIFNLVEYNFEQIRDIAYSCLNHLPRHLVEQSDLSDNYYSTEINEYIDNRTKCYMLTKISICTPCGARSVINITTHVASNLIRWVDVETIEKSDRECKFYD